MTDLLIRLRRRLDAQALHQLRAEAARLAAENEDLRERLYQAEAQAAFWAREGTELHLQLCEAMHGAPGITQAGHLVVAH